MRVWQRGCESWLVDGCHCIFSASFRFHNFTLSLAGRGWPRLALIPCSEPEALDEEITLLGELMRSFGFPSSERRITAALGHLGLGLVLGIQPRRSFRMSDANSPQNFVAAESHQKVSAICKTQRRPMNELQLCNEASGALTRFCLLSRVASPAHSGLLWMR